MDFDYDHRVKRGKFDPRSTVLITEEYDAVDGNHLIYISTYVEGGSKSQCLVPMGSVPGLSKQLALTYNDMVDYITTNKLPWREEIEADVR